jgi:hypothetical protein
MPFFNLFVEQPKSQYKYKSVKDPSSWDIEILSEVQSRLEKLGVPNVEMGSINYSARDDKSGHAAGAAKFTILGAPVAFPFVIEDFKLKPIDVFIFDKRFYPLTSTQLGGALRGQEGVGRPARMDESMKRTAPLYSSVYPPNYGKYLFASDSFNLKSFAKKYGHGLHVGYYEKVAKDQQLVAKCAIAEIYPSIQSLKDIEVKEAEDKVTPRADAVLVVRCDDGYKSVLVHSKGCPAKSLDMDEAVLREALTQYYSDADAAAGKVIQDGSNVMTNQGGEDALYTEDIKAVKRSLLKPVNELAPATIATLVKGEFEKGLLTGHHLDFDLRPSGNMVFVNDGHYAVQPEIYGRVIKAPAKIRTTGGLEPKPGDYCFLVHERKVEDPVRRETLRSSFFAYGPVNVHSVSKVPTKRIAMEMTISNDLGEERKVLIVRGLNTFVQKEGVLMAPINTKFVKTKERVDLPSSSLENDNKLAILFNDPVLKVQSAGAGRFGFSGRAADSFNAYIESSGIGKEAFADPESYSKNESIAILRLFGLNRGSCEDALRKAANEGSVTIHNAQDVEPPTEQLAQIKEAWDFLPKVDQKKIAHAAAVVSEAIKNHSETGMVGDIQKIAQKDRKVTTDMVLSLGLLNPKNVALFIEGLDELESVVSYLAALLVASRVGLPVDEGQTKEALFNIAKVVDQLKTLRASNSSA